MRAAPADIRPFLRNPVSSTASTAPASPRFRTTYRRTASRQASWSHGEKFSSRCIPSGDTSPANSASDQEFFRSVCDSSPSRYARPCRRTAAFPNTPAACANISLNDSDHAACPSPARTRASSTTASMPQAWPARTVRSRSRANHSSLL